MVRGCSVRVLIVVHRIHRMDQSRLLWWPYRRGASDNDHVSVGDCLHQRPVTEKGRGRVSGIEGGREGGREEGERGRKS